MVYTASGRPLYVPPQKKQSLEPELAIDPGMQSLLDAIEFDLHNENAGNVATQSNLESPVDGNMEHDELVADLLGTTFDQNQRNHQAGALTEPLSGSTTSIELDDFILSPDSGQNMIDSLWSGTPFDHFFYSSPEHIQRTWRGLSEKYKDTEVRRSQVRLVVEKNLPMLTLEDDPVTEDMRVMRISFAWPIVAQKSYGSEKRFLTPSPVCKISGPYQHLCGPRAKAHLVICPDDQSLPSTTASTIDFNQDLQANYKDVYFNNKSMSKSCTVQLKVQIAQVNLQAPSDIPLMQFESSNIGLLSKPSKRSTHLQLHKSLLYTGGSISLYNRVNSQTARTKFLNVGQGTTKVESGFWTAFKIYPYRVDVEESDMTPEPLVYNMIVVISDEQSGYRSPPVVLRRLEGRVIIEDCCNHVTQMQKLAFERFVGAPTPGPLQDASRATDESPRSFLSTRTAQCQTILNFRPDPSTEFEDVLPGPSGTLQVDDYAQWTIVGVGSSEFTFLDTLSEPAEPSESRNMSPSPLTPSTVDSTKRKLTDPNGPVPDPEALPVLPIEPLSDLHIQVPLTPFPTLLSTPIFQSSQLQLSVRDFHQPSSLLAEYEVWLSTYGPCTILDTRPVPGSITDAVLIVELPSADDLKVKIGDSVQLLFVREDGIVVKGGCQITIK